MVQRRDLNRPPGQQLADIVKGIREKQDQQRTGSHGVKDMGPGGDIVWTRPEAPEFEVSIRDIDGDLQDAQGRIDEAKADSEAALERADEARTEVGAARDRLDVVENVTIPGVVADLTEAIDNIEVDGDGVTTYQTPYEPDETTDPAPKTGDLWFDTDNDMALHRHDGTVWVSVADGRIPYLVDAQNLLYTDINQVRESVDGKTKITQSLDAPPTQYAGAVGDRWERMSSMGSGGRLVSNWRWNGTVWVSTLIDDAVLGNLDASKLVAGSATINNAVINKLWTDGVMAKTVASNSITVSPGNLLPDPNGNTDIGRNAYANLGFVWVDADKAWVRSPPIASNQTKPNAGGDYTSYPLEGGRTYRLYFEAKVEGGTGGGRYAIYYTRRDGTTAFVGDGVEDAGGDTAIYTPIPADTWTAVDRTWVAPADAVMGGFALQVNNVDPAQAQRVLIRNPFAGVKSGTTMIEPGAITTDRIAANAVQAGKIAAGAIEAQHIEAGAVTADKITVTEELSADIVNAMDLATKKLVVTEEAILNHATLIGETVVEDINVTGKLIGTDGVFTGTVDFENVNVTGLQLVEKLEANSISADKIEGGAFTGESFTGGTFTGGLFQTSSTLPGQVRFSDTAADGGPGLEIEPLDTSGYQILPSVGPSVDGMNIRGGVGTDGTRAGVIAKHNASTLWHNGPGEAGSGSWTAVTPTEASMVHQADRTAPDGVSRIVARSGEVYIKAAETAADYSSITSSKNGSELYVRNGSGVSSRVAADIDKARLAFSNSSGGGQFIADSSGVDMRATPASGAARGYFQANLNDVTASSKDDTGRYGWMKATPGGTELAYVAADNTYFSRVKADAQEAFLYTRAGGSGKYIRINSTGMHLEAEGEVTGAFTMRSNASLQGALYYYGAPSTSSQANVFVSSNGGALARGTSSRRYKKDIVDWSPEAEAVLALRPREWTHDDPNNPPEMADDTRHVGFIAEEVHDLGLNRLVYYSDDEDGNPRPEALNYGSFSAAQQVVLQKHEREIAELKAENAALVARLEAIEAKLA